MKKNILISLLLFITSLVQAYPVHQVWSVSAGATARNDLQLTPALYNDLIVTTDSRGYIIANKQKSGQQVWKIYTNEKLTTGVAMNQHAIVVATHQARVLAYEPKKHKLLWSHAMDSEILAAPVMKNRRVAVKTVDGQITVFDAQTGVIKWRYSHGTNNEILLHASSSPKISGNHLIAGFNDGNLFAFSLNNGQLLWQSVIAGAKGMSQIDKVVDVTAAPIVDHGTVYAANYQGKIKAIDAYNGQTLWSKDLSTYRPLTLDEKNIYAVDESGQVLAFNRNHGGVVWRQPKFVGKILSAPANDAKAVIVADNSGNLYWLDKRDGHLLTTVRAARSAITNAPIVVKNSVYTLSQRGELSKYQLG